VTGRVRAPLQILLQRTHGWARAGAVLSVTSSTAVTHDGTRGRARLRGVSPISDSHGAPAPALRHCWGTAMRRLRAGVVHGRQATAGAEAGGRSKSASAVTGYWTRQPPSPRLATTSRLAPRGHPRSADLRVVARLAVTASRNGRRHHPHLPPAVVACRPDHGALTARSAPHAGNKANFTSRSASSGAYYTTARIRHLRWVLPPIMLAS